VEMDTACGSVSEITWAGAEGEVLGSLLSSCERAKNTRRNRPRVQAEIIVSFIKSELRCWL